MRLLGDNVVHIHTYCPFSYCIVRGPIISLATPVRGHAQLAKKLWVLARLSMYGPQTASYLKRNMPMRASTNIATAVLRALESDGAIQKVVPTKEDKGQLLQSPVVKSLVCSGCGVLMAESLSKRKCKAIADQRGIQIGTTYGLKHKFCSVGCLLRRLSCTHNVRCLRCGRLASYKGSSRSICDRCKHSTVRVTREFSPNTFLEEVSDGLRSRKVCEPSSGSSEVG
jgi:hypothetical protein